MKEKLIDKKVLIAGTWTESESGNRSEVRYPGDGSVIGTVPNCTRWGARFGSTFTSMWTESS